MKSLCFGAIALAVVASLTIAKDREEIEIVSSRTSEARVAPAANFSGTVKLRAQFRRDAPSRLAGALVSFEPGARTDWHTHPHGQTLIVTAGSGFVQRWDGRREKIEEGDVVWIPPETKHWHGATATTPMSHVAVVETLDGETVKWLEKVTDQQYSRD
jgi:quercetin dioxygenase-like cupin family protein